MNKLRKYLRGFCLLLLFPSALKNYIQLHLTQVIVDVSFVVLAISLAFSLTSSKTADYNDLQIVDLTKAFDTGTKSTSKRICVTIHHTAGDANGRISGVAKVHLGDHKWSGIGYHYYIDKNGVIYQLRSEDEVVPHSFHFNNNAIAIVLAGNFSKHEVPTAQWESALKLVRSVLERYNLTSSDVKKHCELYGNSTECCGVKFNISKFREEL